MNVVILSVLEQILKVTETVSVVSLFNTMPLYRCYTNFSYYAPAPMVGGIYDARLTCLSRTSDLSRELRGLGKLKLAQGHVTRDSDTIFKVKGAGGGGILWRPPAQLVLVG